VKRSLAVVGVLAALVLVVWFFFQMDLVVGTWQGPSTCGGMMHTLPDGTQTCGPLVTPTKTPS
jgi:hypothetical protein